MILQIRTEISNQQIESIESSCWTERADLRQHLEHKVRQRAGEEMAAKITIKEEELPDRIALHARFALLREQDILTITTQLNQIAYLSHKDSMIRTCIKNIEQTLNNEF